MVLCFFCLWIILIFDFFQAGGRWLRLSDALKISLRRARMFGGLFLSMLFVMLSVPGAPLALHVESAWIISSGVMVSAVEAGVFGVSGSSGSMLIWVGVLNMSFKCRAKLSAIFCSSSIIVLLSTKNDCVLLS